MRVLHVITALGVGGAERQLVELARRTRHEPSVVGMYDFGHTGQELRAIGVPVACLGLPRNFDLRALPRLVRLIRTGSYDVVHTHLYRATVYGRIAARLANVPATVTTEHSLGARELEGRHINRPIRALYIATDRLCDMTLAPSERVAGLLSDLGVPPGRIVTIPHGVDADAFRFDSGSRAAARVELGIGPDATVIGTVGRLAPGKRQALLIQAAAEHVDAGAWLVIVGEGPERQRLEALADELGIAERVVFTGERHDVGRILSAMDVFAAPASEETFGVAPVEAMLSGLPVVVTRCPALDGFGPPRVRRTGENADELAGAIGLGLRDSLPREGGVPRELREHFDLGTCVARVDRLYEEVGRFLPT